MPRDTKERLQKSRQTRGRALHCANRCVWCGFPVHRAHRISVVGTDAFGSNRFEHRWHEGECRRVAQKPRDRDESKGLTDSAHTGHHTIVLRLDAVKRCTGPMEVRQLDEFVTITADLATDFQGWRRSTLRDCSLPLTHCWKFVDFSPS